MLTLFCSPMTRADGIVWLLEEIGAPYETRIVEYRHADGTGRRDPANPHPHGKVPALLHDGKLVFESGAIALYLTDLFPQADLGPQVGDPRRGAYLSWLFYRSGVMEPAFMERRFGIQHVFGAMGWAPPEEVEEVLNAALAKSPYLLGDRFTAADIMVGGGINYMLMFKMTAETPVLKAYVERITGRPAFQRVMQRNASK